MMWSERRGHEVYVFHNGDLVYKRWQDTAGRKTQNSILLNEHWPTVSISGFTELSETVIPAKRYPAEPRSLVHVSTVPPAREPSQ